MILKHRDSCTNDIKELNRLLTLNLTGKQRFLVERELKCLLSGNSGESSSAYYIDFKYKDSKNWVVIHDLRIDHRGLIAQIDHMLINRFLEIYVLESKNYFYGIKITDNGEFMAYTGKAFQGIESPIEQNKRHVELLNKSITDRNLAPTRLGFPIPVSFKNYVLVAPNSRIDRPKQQNFDSRNVIKADAFVSLVEKEINKMSVVSTFATATKLIGSDTLEEFGQKLVRLHRPGSINYVAKFGIVEQAQVSAPLSTVCDSAKPQWSGEKVCQGCGVSVDKKVVFFCNINKAKFNGQIFCRDCQKSHFISAT